MEAQGLEPPLARTCRALHLEDDGDPLKQAGVIEIPPQPPGARGQEIAQRIQVSLWGDRKGRCW